MELSQKDKLILNYIRSNDKEKQRPINIDIEESLLIDIKEQSKLLNITVEEFIHISIIKSILYLEKRKQRKLHKDMFVIDIFDLYDIENIIENMNKNNKHIFIVNIDFKNHSVMVPVDFVQDLSCD